MIQYRKQYDIVVAGAGVAGVAAALAAARHGKKVALLEKQCVIGGLATSGLVFIYLPLCDGMGRQCTFGIAEELLKLSMKYSPCDLPVAWGGPEGGFTGFNAGNRYQVIFSPAGFTIAMDGALQEAGVDLWLDTLVCAANTNGDGAIESIEVENLSGRGQLSAQCFIDTTGTAALARQAGGAVETMNNCHSPWIIEKSAGKTAYSLEPHLGVKYFRLCNNDNVVSDVLDAKTQTKYLRLTWEESRQFYDEAYANGDDRHTHYPIVLPGMSQLRKVGRIVGKTTLHDGENGKHFDDSIGLYADWRRSDSVWETPYGTLVPEKVRHLLAAGRCMSTENDAWECFRVIPSAAMTGEVAGTAAALSVEAKCDPADLDVERLRNELRKNGFLFHLDELPDRRQ